jgi:hypothetical protein
MRCRRCAPANADGARIRSDRPCAGAEPARRRPRPAAVRRCRSRRAREAADRAGVSFLTALGQLNYGCSRCRASDLSGSRLSRDGAAAWSPASVLEVSIVESLQPGAVEILDCTSPRLSALLTRRCRPTGSVLASAKAAAAARRACRAARSARTASPARRSVRHSLQWGVRILYSTRRTRSGSGCAHGCKLPPRRRLPAAVAAVATPARSRRNARMRNQASRDCHPSRANRVGRDGPARCPEYAAPSSAGRCGCQDSLQ